MGVSSMVAFTLYVLRALTKCVVVELLYLGIYGLDLLYQGLDEFHVA